MWFYGVLWSDICGEREFRRYVWAYFFSVNQFFSPTIPDWYSRRRSGGGCLRQGPLGLRLVQNNNDSDIFCCDNNSVCEADKGNLYGGRSKGILGMALMTTATTTIGGGY